MAPDPDTAGAAQGRVRITFLETGADLHLQEAVYPPRSPEPPTHCHPAQDERFRLEEGELLFRVAGAERTVRAGETIDIPRGVMHSVRNASDSPARALWETRPALRTAAFQRAMERATQGSAKPSLLEAAAVLREYDDVFLLASPPRFVQRLVFALLAPFGRRALEPADPRG